MATTAELRRAVLRAESDLDRTDRALRGVQDLAATLTAQLARMGDFERNETVLGKFYKDQLRQLDDPATGSLLRLTADRDAAASALASWRGSLATAVAAEPPIWTDQLHPSPAVLVPVRVEVRYLTDRGPLELGIRVIPDDIGVHTFEPELTAAELAAGRWYWTSVSAAGVDGDGRTVAWTAILGELGAARAAWTVETLRPTGPAVDGVPPLPEVPTKDRAWTKAATSLLLPDRFVFRGWRGGRLVFEVTGADIPDDLTLGPDPTALSAGSRPADGGLPLAWTGPSAWMVDFGKAVEAGMGVRVPLTGTDVSFDEIFVLGISDRAPLEVRDRLATTLRGHLYTAGLAFPPPDAPTNNTAATRSDWTTAPTMRTPEEVEAAIAAQRFGTDQPGVRVADAFGFPSSETREPGRRDVLVANGATVDDDHALTRLAHQVALAYETTFAALDVPGTGAGGGFVTSRAIGKHYLDLVRTRGPLATMRVGRQPYGVLPVTSLTLWAPPPPPELPPEPLPENDDPFDPGFGQPDPAAGFPDIPTDAVDLLRLVRAAIARQLPSSPRIGRERDQDAVLVDLLHRLPESVGARLAQVSDRRDGFPGPHAVAGDRPPLEWSGLVACRFAPDGAPSLLDPAVHGFLQTCLDQLTLAKEVGSSRVDLQACKLEYSIVSPK